MYSNVKHFILDDERLRKWSEISQWNNREMDVQHRKAFRCLHSFFNNSDQNGGQISSVLQGQFSVCIISDWYFVQNIWKTWTWAQWREFILFYGMPAQNLYSSQNWLSLCYLLWSTREFIRGLGDNPQKTSSDHFQKRRY